MRTVIEADRDGKPLRVYHETTRYVWTHGLDERKTCEACVSGRLPKDLPKMKADN